MNKIKQKSPYSDIISSNVTKSTILLNAKCYEKYDVTKNAMSPNRHDITKIM